MSERVSKSPDTPALREYWQGIAESAAVLWREETYPGGMVETFGPAALVVYGDISWKRLQAIELSKMTTLRPGFPEFDGVVAPDAATLSRRWNSTANIRKREDMRRLVEDQKFRKTYKPTFDPRRDDEPVADFYARVAEFYRMRTMLTGRPTQDLAEAAGVPKSTAARWVREARARGFLPPTSKGRSAS